MKLAGAIALLTVVLSTAVLAQPSQSRLTDIDARQIERRCKLPVGSLLPNQQMTSDFRKIVCITKQFQKRNLKMGFISAPVNPDKAENAQTH